MAGNKRKLDLAASRQTSLFDMVAEQAVIYQQKKEPGPGSLSFGPSVKDHLSQALKNTPCKRWEIAGRMSEYAGLEITESMLNAWTAESKDGHRFPLEYIPAFCWATGSHDLLDMIVRACGCYLIRSEEVAILELAKIADTERQLSQRKKQVQHYLQHMRQELGAK